jgi:hypothetical protein
MKDPIVEEVHAIRRQIAQECGYDMHNFFERQKAIFAQWKGKKVTKPFHPEWRAPTPAVVAEGKTEYITRKKK